MRFATTRGSALSLVLLSAACGKPAPIDYTGPTAEWSAYGGDAGGQRYSTLTQITKQNVGDLKPAWEFHTGDVSDGKGDITTSSYQVTPIVVDSTMYLCTPFNRVIALDPETGKQRWSFDPKLRNRQLHGGYPLTCRGVATWLDTVSAATAPCHRRIYTGTQDAELIALDAKTGRPCEDFGAHGIVTLREGLGDAPIWEYYTTSPPLVVHDLVAVGALVADNQRVNAPPGVVRAFDARTGALRWAWDPVPPGAPPRPTTVMPDSAKYRRSTANVWAIMSADPERDLIFLPTGNAPPDYYGALREGLDYYSSSVVALRASTGVPVWHFQTVHHDLWDYDVAAQPTLFEYSSGGAVTPALFQATKIGHLFALNRENGQPLFPIPERPVPHEGVAPGDTVSPTQPFPTWPAQMVPGAITADSAYGFTFWDRGKCRDMIKALRSDGLFTPPTLQGSIHYPSAAGGTNWSGVAIDPTHHIVVLNQTRVPSVVQLVPRASYDSIKGTIPVVTRSLPGTTALYGPQVGTPYAVKRTLLLSPWGVPCVSPPWGTIAAIDLTTGKKLWEEPLGTTRDMAPWPLWLHTGVPNLGGPIITASGLVFIGAATDQYLRAIDLATGHELWKDHLPFAPHATPLTYRLSPKSKQYVVVAAGGHVFSKTQGDLIIAYALP
jgi:quinoprotein glucose dehydrogenase